MNNGIIENMRVLSKYYEDKGDKWRGIAYQRAWVIIKNLKFEIKDINQVKSLPGIGKSIRAKIKEYLDTGQIRKVNEIKAELNKKSIIEEKYDVIELLKGVWGVGDVKANKLYGLGVKSIEDIKKYKNVLNKNQLLGLKYYYDLIKPVKREYIDIIKIIIHAILTKEFGKNSYRMEIAGSYRRGATQSGDMDVLITSKKFNLKDIVNILSKWNVITETLCMKQEKFMGIAHCPSGQSHNFRMDIEFLPEEEWGSGLLYFTGSKDFNIATRANAKRLGLTLNQHGLFNNSNGKRLNVNTEKEILKEIKIEFILPNNR